MDAHVDLHARREMKAAARPEAVWPNEGLSWGDRREHHDDDVVQLLKSGSHSDPADLSY
jgi:hypothetical protein